MPTFRLPQAVRALMRTPLVSVVAIVSLALGIGANAAIFSLYDQTLLRPLPVARPSELVNLSAPGPKPGSNSCNQAGNCEQVFSYAMFRDLERLQTVFTGLAAHVSFGANLAYHGQTMNAQGMLVSGSYFPILGLQPALGRLFTADDDRNIKNHFVSVLSHDYWSTRLGASPAVPERDDHREWPGADDRRRGAPRLRQHHTRERTEGVRAADDARPDVARLDGL